MLLIGIRSTNASTAQFISNRSRLHVKLFRSTCRSSGTTTPDQTTTTTTTKSERVEMNESNESNESKCIFRARPEYFLRSIDPVCRLHVWHWQPQPPIVLLAYLLPYHEIHCLVLAQRLRHRRGVCSADWLWHVCSSRRISFGSQARPLAEYLPSTLQACRQSKFGSLFLLMPIAS